jgi:hypothetical protein
MKLDETLDPEIFLKYNNHLHLEEKISANQGRIIDKGSEVAAQHDFVSENAEISSSKAVIQL